MSSRPPTSLTRRRFVKGLAGGAAALAASPLAFARSVPGPAGGAESLVRRFADTLTSEQRGTIAFAWDHRDDERGLLRTHVSNNWSVTPPRLSDDFYTKEQRALVREIFTSLVNPDWVERFDRQQEDDGGGFGRTQNVGLFGEPGEGPFELVLTGPHMTFRCDGDSADHVAFGGPIFYGHSPGTWWTGGFVERAHHPGNVFWHQAEAANDLHAMLDGQQRAQAELEGTIPEHEIAFGRAPARGLAVSDLSADQREEMQRILAVLLEPFRASDRDEVVAALGRQGGLDACRVSFFEDWYRGGDGVWDSFRVEGPAFVWHFRGAPHVHVWVHVADDPDVVANAEGLQV